MKVICEFEIQDTQFRCRTLLPISDTDGHYTWLNALNIDGIDRSSTLKITFSILNFQHTVPLTSVELNIQQLSFMAFQPKIHNRRHSTHNRVKFKEASSCNCIQVQNTDINYIADRFNQDDLVRLKISSVHTVIPPQQIEELLNRTKLRITLKINEYNLYKANIVEYDPKSKRKVFKWEFDKDSQIESINIVKNNREEYDCDKDTSTENNTIRIAPISLQDYSSLNIELIKDVFFPFTPQGYEALKLQYAIPIGTGENDHIFGLARGIAICLTDNGVQLFVDNYPCVFNK